MKKVIGILLLSLILMVAAFLPALAEDQERLKDGSCDGTPDQDRTGNPNTVSVLVYDDDTGNGDCIRDPELGCGGTGPDPQHPWA